MRVHLDVLGWLYTLNGIVGMLSGISLGVLCAGTLVARAAPAQAGIPAAVWLMAIGALLLSLGGLVMAGVGWAVRRRDRRGRRLALLVAVPTLVVVPFGTALGVYTFWALLNDEARREFGRPLRSAI